uniref:Uncharacterized protein n=1 Tax=Arundo donax TaxID=35708 RepID=A0A0A9GYY9_ARUDO
MPMITCRGSRISLQGSFRETDSYKSNMCQNCVNCMSSIKRKNTPHKHNIVSCTTCEMAFELERDTEKHKKMNYVLKRVTLKARTPHVHILTSKKLLKLHTSTSSRFC